VTSFEAGEIDPRAPEMYRKFRDKEDGVIKVVLRPGG
jgi:hypothetical protein